MTLTATTDGSEARSILNSTIGGTFTSLQVGTQSNKVSITYSVNTARTYTLPDAGGNADFVLTAGTQTIGGSKTFSSNIIVNGEVSAVDFNSTSDATLKENVQEIEKALSIIDNIRGVTFNFIGEERRRSGVIAQEIEKVFPVAVTETNDVKNVAYSQLIGLLIEAVKELNKKITVLEKGY